MNNWLFVLGMVILGFTVLCIQLAGYHGFLAVVGSGWIVYRFQSLFKVWWKRIDDHHLLHGHVPALGPHFLKRYFMRLNDHGCQRCLRIFIWVGEKPIIDIWPQILHDICEASCIEWNDLSHEAGERMWANPSKGLRLTQVYLNSQPNMVMVRHQWKGENEVSYLPIASLDSYKDKNFLRALAFLISPDDRLAAKWGRGEEDV